jgi:hypothetical protein
VCWPCSGRLETCKRKLNVDTSKVAAAGDAWLLPGYPTALHATCGLHTGGSQWKQSSSWSFLNECSSAVELQHSLLLSARDVCAEGVYTCAWSKIRLRAPRMGEATQFSVVSASTGSSILPMPSIWCPRQFLAVRFDTPWSITALAL